MLQHRTRTNKRTFVPTITSHNLYLHSSFSVPIPSLRISASLCLCGEPFLNRASEGGGAVTAPPLLSQFSVYSVGFGFGLPDEGIHGPDEFYRMSSFLRGQHAYLRLLDRLATWTPGADGA